jgi:hypothetical protein
MNRFLLLVSCLLLPSSLFAAGAILVDTGGTGAAVLWKDGVARFNLESGPEGGLGQLSNEEAAALIRGFFEDWQNVTLDGIATVSLTAEEGESLGSVDASNLDDHFTYCPPDEECPTEAPPFVQGSATTGQSPILFDDDGSMTDAVQGSGASRSILGFAGPRVVDRIDGVLYITEGQALLNGRFIDGISSSTNPEVTVEEFKGAIFHEIGHFLGIDHTQVNLDSVIKYLNGDESEKDAIPTMLPLFVDGEAQFSPHFDDKAAVSFLYPSAAFGSSFCRMEGTAFESDGTTELQGVNVLAAAVDDLLGEATSFVSGSFYAGNFSDCDAGVGDFVLSGLAPGRSYRLGVERVSPAFTGGSSLEPCDPPQTGFDAATIPGVFSCSSGGEVITAGTEATTNVVTTKASTVDDGPSDTQASGGCSLILL